MISGASFMFLLLTAFGLAIYRPMIYTARKKSFGCGKLHYEGKWEGVAPWKSRLLGPCEMASSRRRASAIWVPKKSRFPGPNPLLLAQVMDLPASKPRGHINQRFIGTSNAPNFDRVCMKNIFYLYIFVR
jgi:hypothetical protein